jgi:hypothetical protein
MVDYLADAFVVFDAAVKRQRVVCNRHQRVECGNCDGYSRDIQQRGKRGQRTESKEFHIFIILELTVDN